MALRDATGEEDRATRRRGRDFPGAAIECCGIASSVTISVMESFFRQAGAIATKPDGSSQMETWEVRDFMAPSDITLSCWVVYEDRESALRAVRELHGEVLGEKPVGVQLRSSQVLKDCIYTGPKQQDASRQLLRARRKWILFFGWALPLTSHFLPLLV